MNSPENFYRKKVALPAQKSPVTDTRVKERFSCVSTWCREIQGGEFGNQTYSGGALSFSLSIAATITFDSIESRKAKEH